MKREGLTHPKTHDLAARLGIPRAQAIGHLALLWDFTAQHALTGDIGKWADGAIASGAGWNCETEHSAEAFVAALIASKWVEECGTHRLVIHNWADHCEQWIKLKAQKLKIILLNGAAMPIAEAIAIDIPEGSESCDQTKPNQTKPNQTPAEANGNGVALRSATDVEEYDRTLEQNTAIFQARQSGYSQEEVDFALQDIHNKKRKVGSWISYLPRVLAGNRERGTVPVPPSHPPPETLRTVTDSEREIARRIRKNSGIADKEGD